MASVEGKCKKCGRRYGWYADIMSAIRNVGRHLCKMGGNCEADV